MNSFHLTMAALALLAPLAEAAEPTLHTFDRKELSNKFYSEGAHFGDFNKDGVMDVVSGPFWYEGPDYTTAHEYYPPKPYDKHGYSDNFFAFTADINKDGWTDILIVGFPDKEAIVYLNPQGKEGHWPRHVAVDKVGNESPTLTNLTGDETPELVFIHKGQYAWAEPDPSDPTKPWIIHNITPFGNLHHFTHGMGVGDINGDGRADLLEKNGWWEQPEDPRKPGPWKHHPVQFGENGGAQIYAYDVDGDGDNDVITSLNAHAYGLSWYEQVQKDGKIEFIEHKIQGSKPEESKYGVVYSQLHALDLIDMDGDGIKDLVTGKRHWAHGPAGDPDSQGPAVLYWYKIVRNADGVDFIPYLIDDNSGVGTQVVAGDLNGDGLPDVVVGNKLGTFVLIHKSKKVSEEEFRKAQPQPTGKPVSARPASAPRSRVTDRLAAAMVKAKREHEAKKQTRLEDERAQGALPTSSDGKSLNLDFEKGTLAGWNAEGNAFAKQPIKGDTVARRRSDSQSQHAGEFWIGTFEVAGDAPKGTLTSSPFRITERWASYLIGGGSTPATRVEIQRATDGKVLHQASGQNSENMVPVLVDLKNWKGEEVVLRLVDHSSDGWGHINFDDFRFHATEPNIPNKALSLSIDTYANAGLSAEEAAKAMTVPDGFSVKLFAGEPDVQQPIAFTIDDRGRLWVAECYTYPIRQPDDKANDRIVIFEDSDGDGRFDRRKVFAEKLNLVSGIEVGFGGVFVGAAPYLLFIPDKDLDDHPDGPPEVLLDGWAYQDTHETLNTFIWGPDGWLYGCHGVFTHSNVGKPGASDDERTRINAGIWRYHPTKKVFEVFAHGTSNPWGVDFNDRGQCFLTCCVIPHLFHVIDGARYQRQAGTHFNPYTYADIPTIAVHRHWLGAQPHAGNNRSAAAGGGHAHAGAMVYLGGTWPKEYRDQIFMNNIHGARINEDLLKPAGSGYIGDRAPDFLEANDSWSQILNLRYGPDGNVYMIDWYDANQCHRVDPNVHDRSNGRIFKIVHDQTKPVRGLDLQKLSSAELVKLQLHENDWYVRQSRRILQERGPDEKTHEALEEIAFENPDETRQLRGLWALHVTGGLSKARIDRALQAKSPYVRGWAIQLELENHPPTSQRLDQYAMLATSDPSPVVRLYLASAANRLPVAQRWEIIAALSKHREDAADHNLPLMIWYALEPMVAADPARGLELATEAKIPLLLSFAVRRIAAVGSEDSLAALVSGLGRAKGNEVQQLAFLTGIQNALKGRRQVPMPKPWPAVAKDLAQSPSEEVREQTQQLAVVFGDPAAFAAMRKLITNPRAETSVRSEALASLLAAKDAELASTLRVLIADSALRGQALRGLAAYDDEKSTPAILAAYAELSPSEKRDALATLSARIHSAKALLDAVGDGKIPARDLSADLVRQLRNLEDEDLQKRIGDVWGLVRESPEEKKKLIDEYTKLLTSKASTNPDLALGRAVFAKTCAQCHKLFDDGGNVGPELTGSNRANLEYLLSNVLDPSAVMAKEYQPTVIAMTDGRVITGIVKAEDSNAVTLVTANETVVVPADEVDVRKLSDKSMMPDDLLKQLGEAEVRGLVAYLASPSQQPMLATPENAQTFFNGQDLKGWTGNMKLWSVEDGEIVGKTGPLDHNEFLKSHLVVGDFVLKLKVKLVPNSGNSGIQFRSEVLEDGTVKGYQADIGKGWWGKLYEEHARGLLWDKSAEEHVKVEDWNDYEIVATGSRVQTYLNGKLCVDLDDPKGARRGIIALQIHSGPPMEVRFKDLQLEVK